MMQEVEVLKTIPELVCSYFSEEQFTLSFVSHNVDRKFCNLYTGKSEFNLVKMQKFDQIEEWVR